MRSYRHEARRELIGKIRGPGLCHYRVKAHFLLRHGVEVGRESAILGRSVCGYSRRNDVLGLHQSVFCCLHSV